MSNTQYMQKQQFITHELSRTLAAIAPDVRRVDYELLDSGKEQAIIRCRNGFSKPVNITGTESLGAVLDAVLGALKEAGDA